MVLPGCRSVRGSPLLPSYLGRVRFLCLEKTPFWICLSKFLETEPVSLMGTFICIRDKLPSQGERGPLNGVCTVHAEPRGQSTCRDWNVQPGRAGACGPQALLLAASRAMASVFSKPCHVESPARFTQGCHFAAARTQVRGLALLKPRPRTGFLRPAAADRSLLSGAVLGVAGWRAVFLGPTQRWQPKMSAGTARAPGRQCGPWLKTTGLCSSVTGGPLGACEPLRREVG